jgi:uncharacterized protein
MGTACPTDFDVRSTEASTVIVHHVPPHVSEQFVEWENEITALVKQSPGYVKTEAYPPCDGHSDQWVFVLTFTDQDSLNRWLKCPQRAAALAMMPTEMGSFSMEKMPAGFGAWFADLDRDGNAADDLPGWKMVMIVTFALYPTVMLQSLFVTPWLIGWLGMAFTMLILNFVCVSILQWGLVPPLMTALRRWLITPFSKAPLLNVCIALGMAVILVCLAMLFRPFSG